MVTRDRAAVFWALVLASIMPASCAAQPLLFSRAADHKHVYNPTTSQLSPQANMLQLTTQSTPDPYFGSRVVQVCAAESTPVVFCLDREPMQYNGYEIQLFRRAQQLMGWSNAQLNWSCLPYNEVKDHLAAADGICDIGMAGIGLNIENIDRGLRFSLPTLRGGYKIMIVVQQAGSGAWAFLDAFSWQLWLAIVLTALGVGLVVWALERCRLMGTNHPTTAKEALPTLRHHLWTSLGRPLGTAAMISKSSNASLVIIVYAFLVTVLVTVYTANTAANMTARHFQQNIKSVSDLPGLAVGTWQDYLSDLEDRGIPAVGFPWNSVEDEFAMFDALRSGAIKALVLDSYLLDYSAARTCDVMTVGAVWDEYDQGVAFAAGTDRALIEAYNRALVPLKQQGTTEALVQQYVSPPPATCKTAAISETGQVTFSQVSGLWILLAGSVGIAVVMMVVNQVGGRHIASKPAFHSGVGRLKRLPGMRSIGYLHRKFSKKGCVAPAAAARVASFAAEKKAIRLPGAVPGQEAVIVADATGEGGARTDIALRAYYGSRTQQDGSSPQEAEPNRSS